MTDKSHLLRFGYAPGNYWFVCNDCGNKRADGDKRSTRCEACAETLYSQVTSVEAVSDKHRGTPMTIPHKAVQAAVGAVDEGVNWVAGLFGEKYDNAEEAMKDALTAALPFLQGVKVKALEWEKAEDGIRDRAQTVVGWYFISNPKEGQYNLLFDNEEMTALFAIYDNLETAKAAAQADYEARILSAIEPAPSPRAQVLEEAAQIADKGNAGWLKKRDVTSNKKEARDYETMAIACSHIAAAIRALSSQPVADAPFQDRVKPWMLACFGEEISNDKLERSDRFIEEALELVQAIGYSADRAHALVDYVFNRDIGEPHQEVGGVMVTLAALCLASGLDMTAAGEDELARIWTKVDKIRAKQAAKPTGSALPIALPSSPGASE